jgi:hypothetical protein
MANFLKKGDAVKLLQPLVVVDEKDANNKRYWLAQQPWDAREFKPPYSLFDTYTGVYMGTEYIPIRDRRSKNGVVQTIFHHFFFNNNRICIDPKYVEIIAKFDDSSDMGG